MMILLLSTLMVLTSSNWVSVWIMMEVNTLAMCAIMAKELEKEKMKETATMVYFICQVLASFMILWSSSSYQSTQSSTMTILALMMKMAAWPTYSWYLKIMEEMKMKMESLMIIMTWQKIMPCWMLCSLSISEKEMTLVLLMAILSLTSPIVMMKKNSQMKYFVGIASVSNNGWNLMVCLSSKLGFLYYMTAYSISLMIFMKQVWSVEMKNSQKQKLYWNSSLATMNMSGLPPMMMFWAKVMVVKNLMKMKMMEEMVVVMTAMACFMLYNYMTLTMKEMTKEMTKFQSPKIKESSLMVKMMLLSSMSMLTCFYVLGFLMSFILMG